jgi:hypothetical protein
MKHNKKEKYVPCDERPWYWRAWHNAQWYMKKSYWRMEAFVSYAPILWRDYDWDHGFILIMLKHKISRTRQYIQREGHSVWATRGRDIKNMRIAEQALARMIKNDYAREERDRHRKKYPWRGFVECNDGSGMSRMPDFRPGEGAGIKRNADIEYKRMRADWKFLFDHLNAHLREWWD